MSNLAGIWFFDSRPVPEAEEAWVRDGLRGPHPGAGILRSAPGLLIGQSASAFDDSYGAEIASAPDGAICTWDGRLDNRQDLLSDAGANFPRFTSDAALALRLFQKSGAAGLGAVVGDWSLVIHDSSSRALVLASDYAGVRPLYYCRTGDCVKWSSSLSHLARWSGSNQLDETYVASFLTFGAGAWRTPYQGIYPSPPGRMVRIAANGVSFHPFWNLPLDRQTHSQTGRAYDEELLALFRQAVAVRLPSNAPACVELSGGLDSSSIVCMADTIARQSPNYIPPPAAFTYTHPGSTDEKYVRVVERALDISSTRLDLGRYPSVSSHQTGEGAPAWWGPRFSELDRQFTSTGASVLLTGQLGDFIMGNLLNDSDQAADYLRDGHWLGAFRESYSWSQSLGVPVYSLFWRSLRTAYSPWTSAIDAGAAGDPAACNSSLHSLTPEFLKRAALNRSPQPKEHSWRDARPGRRSRFRALGQMLDARTLQTPEILRQISFTHPFAHRPLVEFMLTIPSGEVCRPGAPRRLMRRAFSQFLPPEILQRKSKATYDSIYRQALLPLAAKMSAQPNQIQLVDRGYADRDSITDRLARFQQGLECNEPQLRQLILFEFWLRQRERASEPAAWTHGASLPDTLAARI